jgi:general secretion pathway protein D
MRQLSLWISAAAVITLSGCGAHMLHRNGMEMVDRGDLEAGIAALAKAIEIEPHNAILRKDYYNAKERAVSRLLESARQLNAAGEPEGAQAQLRKVLAIEPGNGAAVRELAGMRRTARHAEILADARRARDAGRDAQAAGLVASILADDPRHRAALALQGELEEPGFRARFKPATLKDGYAKPIDLDFREANVRHILEALARTSDISFIFDKDVAPELKTTVILRNADIDEAVNLILRNTQLRSKVLNANTVQIYPDTPEKRKEYQELVVRAFYLQDASAAQIQNVLKSLLKIKDVVIDERLNLVTVRDTPEAIRLAERLVALHDLAEPEVMLDLEVIEVQRDALLKLGVQWPNQFGVVPLVGSGGTFTLDELRSLNSSKLGISFSNPSISLRQDAGLTNLLANPRIRVHNREKANVLIGDKVPVITTTSNATGFVAENVQYLDVGLKLAAEPVIHPSNDVSIRINLEVSSIAGEVSTPNGAVAYRVGTRNATTFLRLHDGETQILAGLISDQDRRSASGVPGLSRLPLVGRLFTAPTDSTTKTEIVLSITPRVVRPASRAEAQPVEFWSGTENGLDTKPLRLSEVGSAAAAVAPGEAVAGAPASPAKVPVPPQFVWNGPNHVAPGEEFHLALRAIAAAPAGPFRVAAEGGVEIVDAVDEQGKAVEHADGALMLTLPQAMDGQLVNVRLRARAPGAATVRILGTGGDAAPVYPVTVGQ